MKITEITYYLISDLISDFGGSLKSYQILFSQPLMPFFIWQAIKIIAQLIKDNDDSLEGETIENVTEKMASRFHIVNVYKKLGQVDQI
jgi:hypothetical protein